MNHGILAQLLRQLIPKQTPINPQREASLMDGSAGCLETDGVILPQAWSWSPTISLGDDAAYSLYTAVVQNE